MGFRQGLSLNNCRANIPPTIHFHINSRADGSYYIEVWEESKFEGQYTKTAGRRFLILLHNKHVCPGSHGRKIKHLLAANSGRSIAPLGWGPRCSPQHVTWMIALVSAGSSCNTSMALMVGRISNFSL